MTALYVGFGLRPGLPLGVLLGTLPTLSRRALDDLIEKAIERLDEIDGDPDLEPNGDERDGTNAEDEAQYRHQYSGFYSPGPGCPISDPGGGEEAL